MENKWFPNGGGPSLEPPDPPDDSLFLAEFPRLSPTAGVDSHSPAPSSSTALPVKESLDTVMNDSTSTTMVDSSISASTTSHVTDGSVPDLGKSTSTVQFKGFTVLQSKKSITFPSPKAAKYVRKTLPPSGSHSSAQRSQPRQKSRLITTSVFSDQINTLVLEDHQPAHKTRESSANATGQAIFTTDSGTESVPVVNKSVPLVETLRRKVDRSLKRQGPAAVSALGTPSVHIPEEVYIRGAQVHKEFISCFFCGRAPPYKQIQNVVNYMWGKGKNVEVHTNQLSNSMIVRVPNDYIRQKIVEKRIWYIGDSMFYAFQWGTVSPDSSHLKSVPLWAHLRDVPLDLRSLEGL
ncbi:hypothetical protein Bca4012_058823 [Brassica carinata]